MTTQRAAPDAAIVDVAMMDADAARDALRARRLLLRLAAATHESEQVCARELRRLGVPEAAIARAADLWQQAGALLGQNE